MKRKVYRNPITPQKSELAFTLNDTVDNLPQNLTFHHIDGRNLVIAPEHSNWLVLSNIELVILNTLRKGARLYDALVEIINCFSLKEQLAINEIETFMHKLVERKFFENSEIIQYYPTLTCALHVTNGCNLTCKHCYMDAGTTLANELTTEEWKQVICQLAELDSNYYVKFTGGEPLLQPDILNLLAYTKEKGLNITLKTNGSIVSFEKLKEIIKYTNEIHISLDGATEKVHDAIRGQGSFKKVIQTCEYLKDLNTEFDLVVSLMKENAFDLLENLPLLYAQLNTHLVNLKIGYAMEIGRGATIQNSILERAEFLKIKKEILKKLKLLGYTPVEYKNLKRGVHTINTNCGFGIHSRITANGDIYPCLSTVHKMGNVRNSDLKVVMKQLIDLNVKTSVDNIEECQKCDLKYITCWGGCKVKDFIHTGSYTEVQCDSSIKDEIYSELIDEYEYITTDI